MKTQRRIVATFPEGFLPSESELEIKPSLLDRLPNMPTGMRAVSECVWAGEVEFEFPVELDSEAQSFVERHAERWRYTASETEDVVFEVPGAKKYRPWDYGLSAFD